ncbi:MAG: hypothetical protein HYW88_03100 [Candidatus Sungbacteria bacterium]|nr:hypothetical protein [Candidatus Sungbacteria bacterium]
MEHVLWTIGAVLYIVWGYHIGRISQDIAANWDKDANQLDMARSGLMRFVFFPQNLLCKGMHGKLCDFDALINDVSTWFYLIIMTLFWPLRFVFFILIVASLVVAYIVSFFFVAPIY